MPSPTMPRTKTFQHRLLLRRLCRRGLCAMALLAGLVLAAGPAHATRRVLVWYADGGTPPASVRKICFGTPPPFECSFGLDVDDCRRQVQALLDRWYGNFDAIFTHVPPPASDTTPFDTVVVASSGEWCGVNERTVSRSPLPLCNPVEGGSVAIFSCTSAKQCATLIAKEQAHLIGLQHTNSETDIMDERGRGAHDGFEDRDNASSAPACGRTQNSYSLMLERLGAWPGGIKPDPGTQPPPDFGDAGAPDASAEDGAPGDDAAPAPPPPDAGADVPAPRVDAGAPASESGCSCTFGRPNGAGHGAAGTLVALLALSLVLARRRPASFPRR